MPTMTTVDTTTRMRPPLEWVEGVETRASRSTVDARKVLLAILLFIPLAIGAMIAITVNCAIYAWAAGSEGYRMFRRPANTEGRAESDRWEAGKR